MNIRLSEDQTALNWAKFHDVIAVPKASFLEVIP